MGHKYLVYIKESYVRDVQIAKELDSEPSDDLDKWDDYTGSLLMDIVRSKDIESAIDVVAKQYNRPKAMFGAYRLF